MSRNATTRISERKKQEAKQYSIQISPDSSPIIIDRKEMASELSGRAIAPKRSLTSPHDFSHFESDLKSLYGAFKFIVRFLMPHGHFDTLGKIHELQFKAGSLGLKCCLFKIYLAWNFYNIFLSIRVIPVIMTGKFNKDVIITG